MKILALETSTAKGGAAIIVDGQALAEETTDRQRSHSELLHVFVRNVLEKTQLRLEDIDAFAVGQGPGSFTGLRVAGNAGKTFASAYNKPLVAVDTLTQIAAQVRERSRPVLVMLNAFKNMVYLGLFDLSGAEPKYLKGPLAVPLKDIESVIGIISCTVAGDGWPLVPHFVPEHVRALWVREDVPQDLPTPSVLGVIAHSWLAQGRVFDWRAFTPLYLRGSEAEENARGRLFNAVDAKDSKHGKNN